MAKQVSSPAHGAAVKTSRIVGWVLSSLGGLEVGAGLLTRCLRRRLVLAKFTLPDRIDDGIERLRQLRDIAAFRADVLNLPPRVPRPYADPELLPPRLAGGATTGADPPRLSRSSLARS
jgi:hypothetical protein